MNSSDAGQPPKERGRRHPDAAETPPAPPPDASAGEPPASAPPEAPEQPDGPLTPEQIAFYRRRLTSGFYQAPDVQRRIAERLTDELAPPRPDRR